MILCERGEQSQISTMSTFSLLVSLLNHPFMVSLREARRALFVSRFSLKESENDACSKVLVFFSLSYESCNAKMGIILGGGDEANNKDFNGA